MRLLILISLVALSASSPIASTSPPQPRNPRGAVYHIRPVSFRGGKHDSPFSNIDGITEFQFPNFGLKSVADSLAEASSRYEDSTAEEVGELPKFIEVASSEESPELQQPPQQLQPKSQRPDRRDKRKKQSNSVPLDASYAFGYTSEDQTRHEVADPGGNVNGYYQYVDDEGYVRKVVYTAGPGKGFVVLKKERVKGPISPPSSKRPKTSPRPSPSGPPPSFDITPAESSNQLPPEGFRDSESDGGEDIQGDSDDSGGYPSPTVREIHTSKKKKPIYIVKIRRPSPSSQPPPPQQQSESQMLKRCYLVDETSVDGVDPMTADYDLTPQRLKPRLKPTKKVGELQMPIPLPVISAPSDRYRRKGRGHLHVQGSHLQRLQTPLVFLAGSEDGSEGYDDGSYREEYQYHGTGSSEDPEYPHHYNGNEKPDASYSFGYETETANRLEKADNQGNVRGSYSYIDSAGIKRTVHYIAGATTGFQVLGTTPSAARSVRLEAPTGYVVSRRRSQAPKLSTSEFRYPQQSAIVYHIHPDSQWKPWEATERRKPRKMRKVMRIHRKKSKPSNSNSITPSSSPRPLNNLEFAPSQKELDQSEGTIVVQSRDPQDYQRFRHSTRVNTIRPEIFESVNRKRHASHRAYTDLTDSTEDDDGHRNDPILFSPNYEALNEAQKSRRAIPNPILLKSPSVSIINRGSDSITPYEVAESKYYPVRATDGSEVNNEALEPAESINTQQGYTTTQVQEQNIPVAIVTDTDTSVTTTESSTTTTEEPRTLESPAPTRSPRTSRSSTTTTVYTPRSSGRPLSSTVLTTIRSTRRRGQGVSKTVEPKTASPTAVRMTREETVKSPEEREANTMSTSTRLLQRLGSVN